MLLNFIDTIGISLNFLWAFNLHQHVFKWLQIVIYLKDSQSLLKSLNFAKYIRNFVKQMWNAWKHRFQFQMKIIKITRYLTHWLFNLIFLFTGT